MTRDEAIEAMARAMAELPPNFDTSDVMEMARYLAAAAYDAVVPAIRRAERERCARVADADAREWGVYRDHWPKRDTAQSIAATIRALEDV